MKSRPKTISETLHYRFGEKPLHEYLMDHAIDRPDQTAYIFYGNHITWKQLYDHTSRLAHYLKNQGIKKGDRIALFMQNCPQYLIGHYAIQMLGGIVVPLNPPYKKTELEYFINEAEIKAVIAGQELYKQLKNVKSSSLQFTITTHYTDYLIKDLTLPLPDELRTGKKKLKGTLELSEIINTNHPITKTGDINIWDDVGLMVFTAGTTGRPKAAMLTYGNALFKTAANVQGYQIEQNDRALAVAPLCHIAGMVMGVNNPVYSGSPSVLLTRFEPEAAIKAIEIYKINKMYTVAPMNLAILNHPGVEKRNLKSLRLNFSTSFGVLDDEKLAERWKQLTDGWVLLDRKSV